jgi:hypothetical protein
MSTGTTTRTATYTTVDVENVVRRVRADITMIADSTGAWTPQQAADYAHDIEVLAKKGYLAWVDVTLLSGGTEIKAVRFDVDTDAGSLATSRPGGVLWPKVPFAHLRIVICRTSAYDADAEREMRGKLRIGWTTTFDDTSHSSLPGCSGRNYTSNAYGMKRNDWSN